MLLMKEYSGVEVQIHLLLTLVVNGASFRLYTTAGLPLEKKALLTGISFYEAFLPRVRQRNINFEY